MTTYNEINNDTLLEALIAMKMMTPTKEQSVYIAENLANKSPLETIKILGESEILNSGYADHSNAQDLLKSVIEQAPKLDTKGQVIKESGFHVELSYLKESKQLEDMLKFLKVDFTKEKESGNHLNKHYKINTTNSLNANFKDSIVELLNDYKSNQIEPSGKKYSESIENIVNKKIEETAYKRNCVKKAKEVSEDFNSLGLRRASNSEIKEILQGEFKHKILSVLRVIPTVAKEHKFEDIAVQYQLKDTKDFLSTINNQFSGNEVSAFNYLKNSLIFKGNLPVIDAKDFSKDMTPNGRGIYECSIEKLITPEQNKKLLDFIESENPNKKQKASAILNSPKPS